MTNTLPVRITSRNTTNGEMFEGTVTIPGLRPTKLARRSDGATQFTSRSAITASARNLAKSLGYTDVDFGTPTAVRKAAKVSVRR